MIFRLKAFFLCLAAISGCVEHIRAVGNRDVVGGAQEAGFPPFKRLEQV